MIQLQHCDQETGEHIGGLYVNADFISEVYFVRENNSTHVVMANGRDYRVPQSVSELLDELARLGRLER